MSIIFAIALPSVGVGHAVLLNDSRIRSDRICRAPAGAVVEKIHGTVWLRTSPNDKPRRLDSIVDTRRVLAVGCQVRTDKEGILRIRVGDKSKEIRQSSSWYTILAVAPSSPFQLLLEQYGRIGGRERADPSAVFSPSRHSVVMPGALVIRWNRGPAIRKITLVIQEPGANELWRQDSVDGGSRSLVSESARSALARYRKTGGEGPLLLRLIDSNCNETQVSFSLISPAGEKSLRQQLRDWDRDPVSFVSHLGRAAVFAHAAMFASAAEEYEAALSEAPQSHDLLTRTIAAHRRTGNVERADELTKRLPAGTIAR